MDNYHKNLALRRVIPFLTINECNKIACLNKFFHQHFKTEEFRVHVMVQELNFLCISPVDLDNMVESLQELLEQDVDRETAFSFARSPNLVKNPCGKEEFAYWDKSNGGNGWVIDDWGTFKNIGKVFLGSYQWCRLTQTINLQGYQGKRFFAGTPIARRWDCGGQARVQLIFHPSNTSFDTSVQEAPYLERDQGIMGWHWIKLNGVIPDDATQVQIQVYSKDTQFWAGHYGARLGYITFKAYQDYFFKLSIMLLQLVYVVMLIKLCIFNALHSSKAIISSNICYQNLPPFQKQRLLYLTFDLKLPALLAQTMSQQKLHKQSKNAQNLQKSIHISSTHLIFPPKVSPHIYKNYPKKQTIYYFSLSTPYTKIIKQIIINTYHITIRTRNPRKWDYCSVQQVSCIKSFVGLIVGQAAPEPETRLDGALLATQALETRTLGDLR